MTARHMTSATEQLALSARAISSRSSARLIALSVPRQLDSTASAEPRHAHHLSTPRDSTHCTPQVCTPQACSRCVFTPRQLAAPLLASSHVASLASSSRSDCPPRFCTRRPARLDCSPPLHALRCPPRLWAPAAPSLPLSSARTNCLQLSRLRASRQTTRFASTPPARHAARLASSPCLHPDITRH